MGISSPLRCATVLLSNAAIYNTVENDQTLFCIHDNICMGFSTVGFRRLSSGVIGMTCAMGAVNAVCRYYQ